MKSEVEKISDIAKKISSKKDFAPEGLTHFWGLIKTRPGTMEGRFNRIEEGIRGVKFVGRTTKPKRIM